MHADRSIHIRYMALILFLSGFMSLSAWAAPKKPNILFIFADDQSYETIAAHGNAEVKTPNLDRLATSGVSFRNTYNMGGWNGAVCVASRAMLNTGRMVWRAHAAERKFNQLADRGQTWSQLLKKAGYETYMTGKWHLGHDPKQQGFDVNIAGNHTGTPAGGYYLPMAAGATVAYARSPKQLVEDFDTTVTTIQGVITLYSLVMAMFMLIGAKIGDIIGRRRAFVIGLVIYAVGSGLTAVSWSVASLTLGWSILEGLGAALVLPALAALIAGNYEGKDRITAYAIIGGIAGAGVLYLV